MSGRPVVVKLGGTTIVEQQDVLREIVEERASRPLVVVHGGGKRLTEWLERLGVREPVERRAAASPTRPRWRSSWRSSAASSTPS